jgi:hypothetical protein
MPCFGGMLLCCLCQYSLIVRSMPPKSTTLVEDWEGRCNKKQVSTGFHEKQQRVAGRYGFEVLYLCLWNVSFVFHKNLTDIMHFGFVWDRYCSSDTLLRRFVFCSDWRRGDSLALSSVVVTVVLCGCGLLLLLLLLLTTNYTQQHDCCSRGYRSVDMLPRCIS